MAKTQIWKKKNIIKKSNVKHYPVNSISRLIFSENYFRNFKKVKKNHKVLDIGTYYLNNLLPFKDRGCKLFGVETTTDAVKISKSIAKKIKINCKIKLGTNRSLNFKNNYFDFVMSINTIHYEESKEQLIEALREINRVLKPGGCFVVETNSPKHSFSKSTKKIKKNIFIQKDKKDFRYGQKFFYFSSEKEIRRIFGKFFKKIEISSIEEKYPKRNLAFFDIKCFKKN